MNLFYHSVHVLFAIHLICISVRRVVNSNDVQSQNRLRQKRVYQGSDVTDGQFPFVVFVKSVPIKKNKSLDCEAQICTGTLVHARFVLTLLSCVISSIENTKIFPYNIHIYLKTRPYDELNSNMTYNIGKDIISKPYESRIQIESENVALILMNDTFPEVTTYPRVMTVDPISEGSKLLCTTVGYSLIGRNLTRPIDERIKPSTYDINVVFDLTRCVMSQRKLAETHRNVHPYLCYSGSPAIEHSLCQQGDEGGPLLCKRPAKTVRRRQATTGGPAEDTYDGLYVFGLADIVPECAGNEVKTGGWTNSNKVLFLYMLMHGPWVNDVLTEFDREANDMAAGLGNDTATTRAADGASGQAFTDSATAAAATTDLPAYYDTGDYDAAHKNPVRCKAGGGGARPDVRHGSVAVVDAEARDGHWPAASHAALTLAPAALRCLLPVLCAAAV